LLAKDDNKFELCRILSRINALEFGTFKLTSGKSSSYYIDLRVLPSYPEAFRKICSFYIELIKKSIGVKNLDRIWTQSACRGIHRLGIPAARGVPMISSGVMGG